MFAGCALHPLQAGLESLRLRVLGVAEGERLEHWLGENEVSRSLLASLARLEGFASAELDLLHGLLLMRAPALAISLPELAKCWHEQGADFAALKASIARLGAGCHGGALSLQADWYELPLPGVRRPRFVDLACLALGDDHGGVEVRASAHAGFGVLRVAVGVGASAQRAPSNVWCVELGQLASEVRAAGAASPFTPTDVVLRARLAGMLNDEPAPGAMWVRQPSAGERKAIAERLPVH